MKNLINKIRSWFNAKATHEADKMQYLVAYKSELDYFDKAKLAHKIVDTSVNHTTSVDDEWNMINWSRVSKSVKAQCIELAKEDIETQINEK